MSIWQRVRALFRRDAGLFNLQIEPSYAVKASARNPYFQALERRAREAGFLGSFAVGADGVLRPGFRDRLETWHGTLALDVYPNPAAVEGRTVVDYDDPGAPRRSPRATVVLDDDTELFLGEAGGRLRVTGDAVTRAMEARTYRRRPR